MDPRLRGDDKLFIIVTPAQAGGKRPEGDSGLKLFNMKIVYSFKK